MKLRIFIMLLLCLLIFGGVFGAKYMGQKGMTQFFDNMPVPAATISTTRIGEVEWTSRLEAVGALVAVHGIEVTTESAGKVEAIHFESGDRVEKAAMLLELDAKTDRADLKTFEAQAQLARTELKRLRQLHELDSISQAELDRAESEAVQAQARVLTQRARIAEKEIRAPFSGELGIRRVDLGEYVSPGTPIVGLQVLDPLYVDFSLPEQHLSSVQPGQAVDVRVELAPDEVISGSIQAVESRVDQKTRNFQVRAQIDNSQGRLRPGVFARISIELPGAKQVLLVPRTAISYNAYGNSVFVVTQAAKADDGAEPQLIVRQRFVKTGEARGDFVIVEEGLKAGEEIATSGLLKLRNDQPVVINNELGPDVRMDPAPADT